MKKFSLWCDFIENSFLDNNFLNLLSRGVNGATSNPAIFKNAILNSPIYKEKIAKLK
ncbi:TPA: transaldolase family protein, partial [Campylobacter coli]|nr:transaldolase [Campylobacter coli]EDB1540144.1 transaldolase [Campylobacter coli]